MENKTCSCKNDAVKTVFACSGAADLGRISDLVACKLQNDKVRQVILLLKDNPNLTISQIAQKLSFHYVTIKKYIKQ